MASYSLDLRERVVKAHLEEGQTKSAVARRFEVSRWSVERYVKRLSTRQKLKTKVQVTFFAYRIGKQMSKVVQACAKQRLLFAPMRL